MGPLRKRPDSNPGFWRVSRVGGLHAGDWTPAGAGRFPSLIEPGGAATAPPGPPARSAEVNSAPLAARRLSQLLRRYGLSSVERAATSSPKPVNKSGTRRVRGPGWGPAVPA